MFSQAAGTAQFVPFRSLAKTRCWSRATIAWALTQALAGYACAHVLAVAGSYTLLFSLGAVALLAALALELVVWARRPAPVARACSTG